MRIQPLAATALAALCLLATSAQANEGQGFGACKAGFADSTVVKTETRGELTIAQVQVNDRVWSYNQFIGKPGWSKVLKMVDGGQNYKILADFTEPGSVEVTKACWLIKRSS
jgi:hypothetical protein